MKQVLLNIAKLYSPNWKESDLDKFEEIFNKKA